MRPLTAITILLAVFLASCSKSALVVLYNNTSQDYVLRTNARMIPLRAAVAVTFSPGLSEKDDFTLETVRSKYVYRISGIEIPATYVVRKNGSATTYLQLNPDHKLYLVTPKSIFPVREIPFQPLGFPVQTNTE